MLTRLKLVLTPIRGFLSEQHRLIYVIDHIMVHSIPKLWSHGGYSNARVGVASFFVIN